MDYSEAALDQRIEQLRKGDFLVELPDALAGKQVTYTLARHAFPFGTAVAAPLLLADPASNADARQYQHILREHFACAVAENAHKWYAMEPERGEMRDEEALRVWERCRELELPMRGHCVFWGIDTYVQPWLKALTPAELDDAMQARARRVLSLFQGKITEWDLNNEMIHGDYYAATLGLDNGARYFGWARAIAPGNTYYVNDYDIMSGNGLECYVGSIKQLQAAGAVVGGIGDQAHFSDRVPDSAKLWDTLDTLGQFGLPVTLTEFDIETDDEMQQAEDTRRFYKLCFAHPAVHGILMWGFWEGSHWRPKAALWRRDWTLKPNGQAYLDLLRSWHTEGSVTPDAQGRLRFRGFYGDYTLTTGSHTWRITLTRDHPVARAE